MVAKNNRLKTGRSLGSTGKKFVYSLITAANNNDLEKAKQALADDPLCITEREPGSLLTALHIAILRGNATMISLLLGSTGVDLAVKDRWGRDALDVALLSGHPEAKKMLFEHRASELGLTGPQKSQGAEILTFRPD